MSCPPDRKAAHRDSYRNCCARLTCFGQFTANTMGMVSEAIGLAPLGSSIIPAVFAERAALNRRAGRIVTEAVLRGTPVPRDIVALKQLRRDLADLKIKEHRG